MPFSKEILLGSSAQGGFYNSAVEQSVRFNDDSSDYLVDTPADGNRRKFTIAVWIKRGNLDGNNVGGSNDTHIISATDNNGTNFSTLRFLSQLTSGNNVKNMLQFYTNTSGVADYSEEVTISFRDTAAWFHVVMAVDTEQSTAGNRIKFYINGELQTVVGQHYGQVPEDYDTFFNLNNSGNGKHEIGRSVNDNNRYYDGYMADFNFVDGAQLTPSSFAEDNNGIWIPKAPTVSDYGTNGFRMEFKQTGSDQNSSGVGADTSGKGNHYSVGNINTYDSNMPDCPENNFCTYNPVDADGNNNTFSQGNLGVVVAAQNTNEETRATFGVSSGKWYWEHRLNSTTTTAGYFMIGIKSDDGNNYWTVRGNDGEVNHNGTTSTKSVSYTTNSVVGVYLDMDNGKWYVSVDGTLQNSADLTNGTGFLHSGITGTVHPFIRNASSGGTHTGIGNFGQDSTFGGNETATSNSDSNGNGTFHSSVFSGYLALCSDNLSEPTIGPNSVTTSTENFNTVLYEGDGNNSRAITGVGFQPDWLWIKRRDGTNSNVLMDSSRGSGSNDSLLALLSNVSDVEYDLNDHVRSLDSDGFTLDDDTDNTVATNNSGQRYVAWNWKFNGGTTATNGNGSITSTVQANTDAGQSIVLWSGNETNSATVGHGLSSAPEVIITKCRSHAASWVFGIGGLSQFSTNDYLSLNSTNAKGNSTTFYQAYGSDTFTVGVSSADEMNRNTGGTARTYVSYCFHSVDGFSKMGKYDGNGNGSQDGEFVFTGFSPAWLLIKRTDNTNYWLIVDDKRIPSNASSSTSYPPRNPVVRALYADSGDPENVYGNGTGVDFLSNGFKHRDNVASVNASGGGYFYLAFAKAPFKYANSR